MFDPNAQICIFASFHHLPEQTKQARRGENTQLSRFNMIVIPFEIMCKLIDCPISIEKTL